MDLGHHWPWLWCVAWRCKPITLSNIGLPSIRLCELQLGPTTATKIKRYMFVKWVRKSEKITSAWQETISFRVTSIAWQKSLGRIMYGRKIAWWIWLWDTSFISAVCHYHCLNDKLKNGKATCCYSSGPDISPRMLLLKGISRGPCHQSFFNRNSNSMQISFWSLPGCSEVLATNVCTWVYSYAVVICANFCSDMMLCDGVTPKPCFY